MLLEVEDIRVFYGNVEAVKGLTLGVGVGEIVALIGANGAGKTTSLKAISGVRPVRSGRVRLEGQDITQMAGHRRVSSGLCQVPEGRGIFPGMSVLENLEMGAFRRRDDLRSDFERVFDLFPRLAERRKLPGGVLSGGEQQMLAIARALMSRPKVLLLDEPSMGLAPILVRQIFAIVRDINLTGTTVLLVEQNAVQALNLAHRAYVLELGRVVRTGPAAELLRDPAVREAYLGGSEAEADLG
jgi:branched-chain amino acid transport system ATP-binding protein